ncbi:unnamed protein product [Notodromas monacha]|uniref:RanBD1 domain-containing protein n=1 Tax=Notodromas monacha TaxID=399045 RepID=A0A7R9BJ00_9CRUS|nr:unnamed protein product [Notodromas monacha]CAG0914817.1 unnamed protein product [Notodromas monacha]
MMSGKRRADNDLNHENWDKEDPAEDSGVCVTLTEEQLRERGRKILKARRKLPASSASTEQKDGGEKPNLFASFSGFGKPSTAPASSPFGSFAAEKDKAEKYSKIVVPTSKVTLNGTGVEKNSYVEAIKKLNEDFVWKIMDTVGISSGVKEILTRKQIHDLLSKDGQCKILTPCFASYNKHLEEIELKHKSFAIVFKDKISGSGNGIGVLGDEPNEQLKASIKGGVVDNPSRDIEPVRQTESVSQMAKISTLGPAVSNAIAEAKISDSASFGTVAQKSVTPNISAAFSMLPSSYVHSGTVSTSTSSFSFAKASGPTTSQSSDTSQKPLFSFLNPSANAEKGSGFSSGGSKEVAVTTTSFSFGKSPAEKEPTSFWKTTESSGAESGKGFAFGKPSFAFGKSEEKSPDVEKTVEKTTASDATKSTFSFGLGASPFSFGSNASGGEGLKMGFPSTGFSFGSSATSSTSASTFSSGNPPLFNFGSTLKTNFAATAPPAAGAEGGTGNNEEEEYTPPVAEAKDVEEEGSFFKTKTKFFYKVDGEFKPKGVGTLFLKKLESGQVQVLVRTEVVGNTIVFNVILTKGQRVQRLQKNNVLFICVANPPHDPKVPTESFTPVLFRTGSPASADELFKEFEKAIEEVSK